MEKLEREPYVFYNILDFYGNIFEDNEFHNKLTLVSKYWKNQIEKYFDFCFRDYAKNNINIKIDNNNKILLFIFLLFENLKYPSKLKDDFILMYFFRNKNRHINFPLSKYINITKSNYILDIYYMFYDHINIFKSDDVYEKNIVLFENFLKNTYHPFLIDVYNNNIHKINKNKKTKNKFLRTILTHLIYSKGVEAISILYELNLDVFNKKYRFFETIIKNEMYDFTLELISNFKNNQNMINKMKSLSTKINHYDFFFILYIKLIEKILSFPILRSIKNSTMNLNLDKEVKKSIENINSKKNTKKSIENQNFTKQVIFKFIKKNKSNMSMENIITIKKYLKKKFYIFKSEFITTLNIFIDNS